MFQAWFNCAFFDANGVIVIDKYMLDKACKDKNNKKFSKEFHIEIHAVNVNKSNKIETIKKITDSQKTVNNKFTF